MEKNTGFKRVIKAAGYSWQGLTAAIRYEAAFRQECALLIVAVPMAIWLADTAVERVMLIGVTVLVLIVELLNSGLEVLVDRVGTEHHELSGRAKDLGSAAVFVTLLLWGYVWIEIGVN